MSNKLYIQCQTLYMEMNVFTWFLSVDTYPCFSTSWLIHHVLYVICINFSVSVRHQLNFSANGSGKLDITVSPKNAMGRTVSCRLFSLWLCFIVFNSFMFLLQLEAVKLEIPMPKSVLNCSLTASQGKYAFDPVSKGNNFFLLE